MIKFLQSVDEKIQAEIKKIESEAEAKKLEVEAKVKADVEAKFEAGKKLVTEKLSEVALGLEGLGLKWDDEAIAYFEGLKAKLVSLQSLTAKDAEPVAAPVVAPAVATPSVAPIVEAAPVQ